MRQAGIIAAAGFMPDHHIERLKRSPRCKAASQDLTKSRHLHRPEHVETNIVIFDITEMGMTAAQVNEKKRVLIHPFGKHYRLVTTWIHEKDVLGGAKHKGFCRK
jgi:hypothetical protein